MKPSRVRPIGLPQLCSLTNMDLYQECFRMTSKKGC